MRKIVPIGILLGLVIVASVVVYGFISLNDKENKTTSFRPEYCLQGECVGYSVFSNLPEYPKNMNEVRDAAYVNVYGVMENFSVKYPDENYYKQPEFYPDNQFTDQWLQYYTYNKLRFSGGFAPYPGDIVISNKENSDLIKLNDTIPVVSYWHTGAAISKYQPFKLVATFPENMKISMGDYYVEQNSEKARECLDIQITPENVFLGRTYQTLDNNWVVKVKAFITIKCVGEWVIEIIPEKPDNDFILSAVREYGIYSVATSVTGGGWRIFLSVI